MPNLPRTDIADLPAEERQVAEALIEALGDDLAALAWQGSWARGEPTASSDHDLFLAMRRLDDDLLLRIRKVVYGREGWSLFIKTEEELHNYPLHGRLQFKYGMTLVFGDFEPPPVGRAQILGELRAMAIDLQHEARIRLAHARVKPAGAKEEMEARRHASLTYYWAKVALLAMKARELLDGREYPLTRAELRARIQHSDELALLDVVENWEDVKTDYEQDLIPLALLLDRFVRRLVSELPAE